MSVLASEILTCESNLLRAQLRIFTVAYILIAYVLNSEKKIAYVHLNIKF